MKGDKNYMMISIDAEKAFAKTQHLFTYNNNKPKKLKTEGKSINLK